MFLNSFFSSVVTFCDDTRNQAVGIDNIVLPYANTLYYIVCVWIMLHTLICPTLYKELSGNIVTFCDEASNQTVSES